jgi:Zn-finger nucleic acid-binding protein
MSGHDQEDAFFYTISRELIEGGRKRLIQDQIQQAQNGNGKSYWMKCPKCGGELSRSDFDGMSVDQCAKCSGVFFDAEEFATLVKHKRHVSFFSRFIRFLTTPSPSENPMF